MKYVLSTLLLVSSVQAFALVNPKFCPERLELSAQKISVVSLNTTIDENPFAKIAWEDLSNTVSIKESFKLVSRTGQSLCIYSNGQSALYLQTNDGQDELVYSKDQMFLRVAIKSLTPYSLVTETKGSIIAPLLQIDSDGGSNSNGEVKLADVAQVNVQASK